MRSRSFGRAAARGAFVLLVAGLLTACDAGPTSPEAKRAVAPSTASRDGDPGPQPETTCRSGWMVMDGKWYCENP
jgi:hypothetical protein